MLYRFNLNSFLPQPSWVGPSYLGALLNAAETEGYSVFVVRAAAEYRATLQNSTADDVAATLPHASEAGGGGQRLSSATSTQGLRPSIGTNTLSFNSIKHIGQDDEEADIQAALRASMAGADLGSTDTGISRTGATSSRMQSPVVAGQRRVRGGNSGEEDSFEDEEETDAHVDAIAPSRRRARGMGPGEGSSLVTSRGMGVPYILPTASGGRRRTSRLHNEEEERTPSRTAQRALRRPSGSTQHPISIDDDDDDDDIQNVGNSDIADDVDDFEELNMASSAPRSPFLHPALVNAAAAGGSGNNTDDDFHSISSGDGILEESWIAADAAVLQRQALINDRSYDDEDAQLQAALEASMRDADSSIPPTADWLSEEDSRAIQEAQMSSWNRPAIARQDTDQGVTPADVAKIAKMRAEAKQLAEDERLGITRVKEGDENGQSMKGKAAVESDDDEEEDSTPQMSPEEMRKARLARFAAQ
jgi:ataxin-3